MLDFLRHKIVQKEVENEMQEEYRLTLQMKYYSLGELDEGIFEKDDLEKLLYKVINSLPEKCREIFLKSKLEGKKQKEIAEEMNISINTVETQMGIAYKKLRNELKDYFLFLYFCIIYNQKKRFSFSGFFSTFVYTMN